MTREELNYKLTGTETPKFLTERENKIIDICLGLINSAEPVLESTEDKPSTRIRVINTAVKFKEFCDACYIVKTDNGTGFVIFYKGLKVGWKYRVLINGTKKPNALRAAYYLLFGEHDDNFSPMDYIKISDDDEYGIRIPLGGIRGAFWFQSDRFTASFFKELMAGKINLWGLQKDLAEN